MKPSLALLWIACAIALAGCSSTPAKVDTGTVRARTFSFVKPGVKPSPAYADNRQAIHAMVQDAITKNLAAKGVSLAASGGDVTVGYLVIIGNNASTAAINEYFGYGRDSAELHEKAQAAYTANKNPNYFEAGTLVVDLVDSRTFKLLKRGYATRPVIQNLTPDARATRIQEVVDEILRDARFAP
jgi:hypothetical protein